ncbi:MAG: CCA tRNA nucleotidyltransferase [Firmicutes bacterium]|nr:CCA tRNA nucleotidyltransferase [Bacillota bacterium]
MNIPEEVKEIIQTLNINGHEAYIVGGCVRDKILSKAPKDWDITTSALPEQIKSCFSHTVDTGIEHGTVTVIINKNNFEVTTYRIDGDYGDNRHPDSVKFTSDITEDLSRRDFTMNAIAYDITNDTYIDPFNGHCDIKNKIIRAVGDADTRFNEDALRMMRAIRFSAQLGFDIEEKTYLAIKKNFLLIKNISIERIRDEFLKLILSDVPEKAVLLCDTSLIDHFLPELKEVFLAESELIKYSFDKLEKSIALRIAFLFRKFDDKAVSLILKRMRFDNNTIKEAATAVKFYDYPLKEGYYETRKVLSMIGVKSFKAVLNIRFLENAFNKDLIECKKLDNIYDEIDDIIKRNDCFELKDLCINGEDIKKNIDGANGRVIGEYLKKALDIVMKDPTKNEKNILIEELKR